MIRVRDNGMGLAPEMLPRIFDLFTQADGALSRSHGGWGSGWRWCVPWWRCKKEGYKHRATVLARAGRPTMKHGRSSRLRISKPTAAPGERDDPFESALKTQGEIEAAICQGMSRFEQEYMGRGPKDIHAHLIGDLLVVRLQGVLTAAEQQLVKSLPAEKGRTLFKQVRGHLVETARPTLEGLIRDVTGVSVLSLHHDVSTVTGEEVILFTLAQSPDFREANKK